MIMSGGSKQPRCLPRCDRCFSVLFGRSSSAVVCLLVKRLSHGRKCLQPCCCRNSQRTVRRSSEHSAPLTRGFSLCPITQQVAVSTGSIQLRWSCSLLSGARTAASGTAACHCEARIHVALAELPAHDNAPARTSGTTPPPFLAARSS